MTCANLQTGADISGKWRSIMADPRGLYLYVFVTANLGACPLNQALVDEFRNVVKQRANVIVRCVALDNGTVQLLWSADALLKLGQLVPEFVVAGCDDVTWSVAQVFYYAPGVPSAPPAGAPAAGSGGVGDKLSYWLNPFDTRMYNDLQEWVRDAQQKGAAGTGRAIAALVLPVLVPLALLGIGYAYVSRKVAQ